MVCGSVGCAAGCTQQSLPSVLKPHVEMSCKSSSATAAEIFHLAGVQDRCRLTEVVVNTSRKGGGGTQGCREQILDNS